jgi:hypothetical protein
VDGPLIETGLALFRFVDRKVPSAHIAILSSCD